MCANDWPSLEDAISATKWPTLENCAFEMIAFLSRYHFAKCWCSDGYQTFPTLQRLRSLHFSRGSLHYLATSTSSSWWQCQQKIQDEENYSLSHNPIKVGKDSKDRNFVAKWLKFPVVWDKARCYKTKLNWEMTILTITRLLFLDIVASSCLQPIIPLFLTYFSITLNYLSICPHYCPSYSADQGVGNLFTWSWRRPNWCAQHFPFNAQQHKWRQ